MFLILTVVSTILKVSMANMTSMAPINPMSKLPIIYAPLETGGGDNLRTGALQLQQPDSHPTTSNSLQQMSA